MAFKGALVKKASDQTGANYTTQTTIAWDSEVYDTDSFHDNSSNNTRLTVPSGIDYVDLWCSIRCANVTALDTSGLEFFKNGAASFDGCAKQYNRNDFASNNICLVAIGIPVVSTDYFEVKLKQASDTSIDLTAARCMFGIMQHNQSLAFSGAMVKKSTDQTAANYTTLTAVAFDSEVYDTNSWHDNSSNNTRLTVPSGVTKVNVFASVHASSVSAGLSAGIIIEKNGSSSFDGASNQYAQNEQLESKIFSAALGVPVTAGDYFELFFQQLTDTSITIDAARTMFGIRVVE